MVSPTVDRRFGLVGNTPFKAPVAAAATANITLSGQQTVDGVALLATNAAGVPDRVLVAGQTDPTQNGIYDVSLNAWSRSPDADGPYDLANGTQVLVGGGTLYVRTVWCLVALSPVTIGTSALTWQLAIGSSLGNFLQAGAGAVARTFTSKDRDTLSVKDFGATGDGLTDDTAACKAALVAGAGKTVFFPPGDYLVSDSLPVPASTCVMGAGYGSRILTPAAGWNMSSTDHFGILNVKGVDNVRITNVRLYGTKTQDNTHSPKLVYLETANDLTIDHCWLENQAFEGIWGGGVASASRRIIIAHNHITNVGYPAGAFVGLPAIQPNGYDIVITGNELYDVGSGISASGINLTVSNNLIRQFTLVGIGTGDSGSNGNIAISGNVIEFSASVAGGRKGIVLDAGGGTVEHLSISGNAIRVLGLVGAVATAIHVGSGIHVNIDSNIIEIDVLGSGIVTGGQVGAGGFTMIRGNTIRVTNEGGTCFGINGIPSGAGNTLTVYSAGNMVYGCTRANNSYAIDYNANGGGTLNATCDGDIFTQGNFRIGPTNYAGGQLDNTAVYMRSDITKSADYHSAAQLGVINVVAPAGQTNIAAGVLTLAGVVGGVGNEARRTRVKIETEGAAATDDLDTINGTQDGDILILSALNAAHTVVVKDGTGNMKLAGDFSMDNSEDRIMLINDGGTLFELCRSDNGA